MSRELTSNGLLNKLQAQLRAHIYTTLATHTQTHNPTTTTTPPTHQLPTPLPPAYHTSLEGTLILALFQEYCTFHHLHNTLSVLQLETSQPKPPPAVDRLAIARGCHISSASAAGAGHSLAYELYLLSQTSRPSSPLVSPRSEPHPIPLSHHASSPSKHMEDLTPPVLSPARHLTLHSKEDDDLRRLHEVESQLAAMRASKATNGTGSGRGGGESEGYSEDWTGVSLDGSSSGGGVDESGASDDVYASDEVVLDGERWAKRYDYVEAVQRTR